jgi:flagellar basal-body rod protein FlgB
MFDKLTSNLTLREKSLDATWIRNEVIANNIANVDTPNFKKSTVNFEEYLDDALDSSGFKGNTTSKRHIRIGKKSADDVSVKITKDYSELSTRLDGNNVDIETEMASMAKNVIRYNTLIQSVNNSYQRLKSAIREGGR